MRPTAIGHPCGPIQADLSAMLDGELDESSVRRVMVHVEVCEACGGFFSGIRQQASAHRVLHASETAEHVSVPAEGGGEIDVRSDLLRRQLLENRDRLAKILYELGRGYVLMGLSPKFSRIVSREPVPIPDVAQQGQHLVAEVERLHEGDVGREWVRARQLLGRGFERSPEDRLDTGIKLLREALVLAPDLYEIRIYLGHALHVAGFPEQASDHFESVLEDSEDLEARGFARLHLGNVHLEAGRLAEARTQFLELVESGAVDRRPQLGPVYFNLALCCGRLERLEECESWLERLDRELPHRRRMIADEIRQRPDFLQALSRDSEIYRRLSLRFPHWFGSDADLPPASRPEREPR